MLSADAWTTTYALLWTLAALFSHSSIAINSVAGPGVHLNVAARSIAPTVIIASAESAEALHADTKLGLSGTMKALAHSAQTSALDAGYMPNAETVFTALNAPHKASVGTTPGKLRLLMVSERAGAESPPLSSHDLSDLRIFTGARVLYALTAASVAGAVAQSGVFDYRRQAGKRHAHFGPPLSSVEIKVTDSGVHRTTDAEAKGEVSFLYMTCVLTGLMLTLPADCGRWTGCCGWRGEIRCRGQVQRKGQVMDTAKLKAFWHNNSTHILYGASTVSLASTVVFAVRAGAEANRILSEEKMGRGMYYKDMTRREKVKILILQRQKAACAVALQVIELLLVELAEDFRFRSKAQQDPGAY